MEALRRNGLGFRDLTQNRIRSLLHGGLLRALFNPLLNYEEQVLPGLAKSLLGIVAVQNKH